MPRGTIRIGIIGAGSIVRSRHVPGFRRHAVATLNGLRHTVRIQINGEHGCAFFGEEARGRTADAGACAGDNRAFSFKSSHG